MKVPLISFYIEIALSKYIMFSTFQHYSFHCLDSLLEAELFQCDFGFWPFLYISPKFPHSILFADFITSVHYNAQGIPIKEEQNLEVRVLAIINNNNVHKMCTNAA